MSFALHPGAVLPGGQISEAERAVRVDLAAAYRLAALNGWDDLIYTHLSATVPGEPDHVLINAFGLAFDEITASNLVKINCAGQRVQLVGDWPDPAARPSVNVTGFALHAAVHAARPDAHCVIHLHNTAGIAVSAQRHGLLPLSQHALRFHRRLAYHDYEGLAFTPEEGARLTASLGSHRAMLLRNHGTLTVGRTVAEAYVLMATLIKACEIQIQALTAGAVVTPTPPVADRAAEQLEDGGAVEGVLEWPALLRKLDRMDHSYRD
ncbi:class II aldolase/adducin family protein [Ralstonia solanacearum]|uniref:class II aldolase/adducin family protein n=1 Tax=Ralstonia solanacearum TaxID=305 RepID=UPI0005C52B52|nr:class II aldolase/adducin family protein [Ralstonia solanacearum]MBB6591751.1 class II aldolase/adducin family protein [Ralstonia solanacearum]MBB6595974.1 class II aldolase/adducin family protein [Ralstonia solanacearum]MDB0541150.1 class II aldolase/adducin family protein [Ralstonia solanacearum]MDB0551371.1 class II aldolase/adducin family protein [Ralstonia solanacearum]MDB0556099.1 class II aldolase/adducin family protein [Ralstonia solanacearum]